MRHHVMHHGIRRRRALRRRALWTGGELLVTVGVLLLLLVVHQLWWTNREAREGARRQVEALEREWDDGDLRTTAPSPSPSLSAPPTGRSPSSPDTGGPDRSAAAPRETLRRSQGYAILGIPRLGLRVPVAEGVGKRAVLNQGYVGHYPGTGQPGQVGNFALAGHRNTHGEPFRYVNRLRARDTIEVETEDAVYTYAVSGTLPQTSAHDTGVIREIPRSTVRPGHGYTDPGYYITLTTCTPEYSSRYRLVVWGTLASMRPRE
ncbi:class E sortase [Streptomyces sp. YU58]|uniref:class E sortase n=1 Tax=Streptomyces sp. SX92 TaxID=3158972 RepID=UPI0027BAE62C|nr:class E sortase [Streptomyces coralus]WLW54713.1 class E sortase [Streptomyces coralus]